jgi:hypothetical protein
MGRRITRAQALWAALARQLGRVAVQPVHRPALVERLQVSRLAVQPVHRLALADPLQLSRLAVQ